MKKLIVLVAVGLSLTNGLFAQSVGKRITAEGEANYSKPTEGKLSSKLMQRENSVYWRVSPSVQA